MDIKQAIDLLDHHKKEAGLLGLVKMTPQLLDEIIDTLRAQLESRNRDLIAETHRANAQYDRAEAAETECVRISESIGRAFDAAMSDIRANKGGHGFDYINGAYCGLDLLRMEIIKARTKEQQA